MDFRDDLDAPISATSEYSRLNDAQLRSAIRFAEAHLRSVEEDHDALHRAYCDEIALMRGHLIDRLLVRIITRARPSSELQRGELRRRFERRATPAVEAMLEIVASAGRAVQVGMSNHEVALRIGLLTEKELDLLGVSCCDHDGFDEAVRVAERNERMLERLVSHRFPLERFPEALRFAIDNPRDVLKVVILDD